MAKSRSSDARERMAGRYYIQCPGCHRHAGIDCGGGGGNDPRHRRKVESRRWRRDAERGGDAVSDDCQCGHVMLGEKDSGAREWNPHCERHGVGSAWWADPQRVSAREAARRNLIELYGQARKARRDADAG